MIDLSGSVNVIYSPSGETELARLAAEVDTWSRATGVPVTLTRLSDHKDGLVAHLSATDTATTIVQVTPDVLVNLTQAKLLAAPPDDVVDPAVRACLGAAFEVDGRLWAVPKDYSLISLYRLDGQTQSTPTFMNPVYERIAPFLFAHGGGTVLDGGGGPDSRLGNLEGVRRLQSLLRAGDLVFPQTHGHHNTVAAARSGLARSALEGPWLRQEVPLAWSEESVRPLTGGDTTLALCGGWAATVGTSEAGWDLVRWLTAPDTLDRLAAGGGPRPAHRAPDHSGYRLLRPTAGARTAIWAWQSLIGRLPEDPPELLAAALSVSSTQELT